MSKNITIQEAGLTKNLTVDALRLKTQSGGTEDWVPADGKNLVELQIGGSGTYKASDYSAYGIAVARVKPKYGGGATPKLYDYKFSEKSTPSIKEGGKPRIMTALMLKTNLQGSGTCLWIPKDNVALKTKYITKSGTYPASADECYGFSEVTVSGVDVTIDKDEDGDDVAEVTDGGVTTQEKLPSEIRIEHEPNFTGPYGDRAYISFDGLVVKAYTASGKLWTDVNHPNGVIPISELTLPVTVTDISQATTEGRATSDLIEGEVVFGAPPVIIGNLKQTHYLLTGGTLAFAFNAPNKKGYYVAAKESFTARSWDEWGADTTPHNERTSTSVPVTHNGKTAYYAGYNGGLVDRGCNIPTINRSIEANNVAWTILYGDVTLEIGQDVPVQWNRPYDNQLLETSFNVEVVDIGPMGGQGED